jgi:hypothetical protein
MHFQKFPVILLLSLITACINQPANIPVSTPVPSVQPTMRPALSETEELPAPVPLEDLRELQDFSGKVYDENGNLLDNVNISARDLDDGISWYKFGSTVNGIYKITGAPVGTRIELTAQKERYLESKQVIILKSSISQDVNNFNFGGPGNENYALKEDLSACTVCKNNITKFCPRDFDGLYDGEMTTITGKIFAEKNKEIVNDAIVTITSVNPIRDCTYASVTATDGTYRFRDVPIGSEFELKVAKPGFMDMAIKVIPTSNLIDDYRINYKNIYDFFLKK